MNLVNILKSHHLQGNNHSGEKLTNKTLNTTRDRREPDFNNFESPTHQVLKINVGRGYLNPISDKVVHRLNSILKRKISSKREGEFSKKL